MKIEEFTCKGDVPWLVEVTIRKWFAQVAYPELRSTIEGLVQRGEDVWFSFKLLSAEPISIPGMKPFYRVELAHTITITLQNGDEIPTIVPEELRVTYLDTDM